MGSQTHKSLYVLLIKGRRQLKGVLVFNTFLYIAFKTISAFPSSVVPSLVLESPPHESEAACFLCSGDGVTPAGIGCHLVGQEECDQDDAIADRWMGGSGGMNSKSISPPKGNKGFSVTSFPNVFAAWEFPSFHVPMHKRKRSTRYPSIVGLPSSSFSERRFDTRKKVFCFSFLPLGNTRTSIRGKKLHTQLESETKKVFRLLPRTPLESIVWEILFCTVSSTGIEEGEEGCMRKKGGGKN